MNKRLVATFLFAMLCSAASGMASPAGEDPQHRNPGDAPKTGQAEPRNPPQKPRPDRPQPPRRGPVVVGVPGWPWWYPPYPYNYPPYDGWQMYEDWQTSNVRVDVEPDDAQVYVDRFFAGVVDDFDGIFQHLTLRSGPHLMEIRKTGFVTLVAELNLFPGQSITYRRTMQPSDANAPLADTIPPAPGFEEGAAPPAPLEAPLPPGDLKFDVAPKEAEVYVDGFYAGLVDDFNGSQHLLLAPGVHHVSIQLPGFERIDVDMSIVSERSITYRAEMKKGR